MDNLLLSIVIPVYNEVDRNNGEKRLKRCLETILNQECHDIEIICVDDGSTDNSLELLTAYENIYSNVTVIHNECNKGLGHSRNRGMQCSQGEYIWFIDADDYIESMSLKKIKKLLTQNSLDILCFDMKVIKGETESVNHLFPDLETEIKTGEELFCQMVSANKVRSSVCGHIYKNRYLQEEKLVFTEGTVSEDVFFSMRALIGAKKAKYVQQAFYIYHKNLCSISTTTTDCNYFIGAFVAYCNMFDFWYTGEFSNILNNCITKNISNYYNIAKSHFNVWERELIDLWMENANKLIYKQYQLFIKKEIDGLYLKDIGKDKIEIIKQYDNCIIYGAGVVAKEFAEILHRMGQRILAYAVSKNAGTNPKNIYGVCVVPINDLVKYKDSALVIIATLPGKHAQIEDTLSKLGFLHVLKLIDGI